MKYILLALVMSSAAFGINGSLAGFSTTEYTSVRNLPVIMQNEDRGNNRCRLHLDNGEKIDVACVRQWDD